MDKFVFYYLISISILYSEDKWWEDFQDPFLNDLVEEAINKNYSLSLADIEISIADSNSVIVASKLFPSISAIFNFLQSTLSENGTNFVLPNLDNHFQIYQLGLNFFYELDIWRKNGEKFKASLGETKIAKITKDQTKVLVISALVDNYWKLRALKSKESLLREIYSIKEEILHLITLSSELIDFTNTTKIKEEIEDTLSQISTLSEEIVIRKTTMNVLLGRNDDLDVDSWNITLPAIFLPTVNGELLSRRPDLKLYLEKIAISNHLLHASILEFLPTLDISGSVGLISLSIDKLFDNKSFSSYIIPSLRVPILDLSIFGNYKMKKYQCKADAINFEKALLEATSEVRANLSRIRYLEDILSSKNRVLQEICNKRKLTSKKFDHGLIGKIDLLRVIEESIIAEIDLLSSNTDWTSALVAFIKSIGGSVEKKIS